MAGLSPEASPAAQLSVTRLHSFQPPKADQMSDLIVRVSTQHHIHTLPEKLADIHNNILPEGLDHAWKLDNP